MQIMLGPDLNLVNLITIQFNLNVYNSRISHRDSALHSNC